VGRRRHLPAVFDGNVQSPVALWSVARSISARNPMLRPEVLVFPSITADNTGLRQRLSWISVVIAKNCAASLRQKPRGLWKIELQFREWCAGDAAMRLILGVCFGKAVLIGIGARSFFIMTKTLGPNIMGLPIGKTPQGGKTG